MYDGSQDGGDGCQTFQYEGQPELPNHLNPCVMVMTAIIRVMITVRLLIIRMQIQVSQFFRPSLNPVIYWGT